MNALIINQWSTNKGDRSVAYFLIRELLKAGVDEITISTSNIRYWQAFNEFSGAKVKFIPFGWTTTFRKAPRQTILARLEMKLKHAIFRSVAMPLIRGALIKGINPWYVRMFCTRQYLEAVKKADVVISTGGHRVTTLLVKDMQISAAFDMAIALLNKKPLVLWSQTIGPLDFRKPVNRQFVQKILQGCFRIIIRDANSVAVLRDMGVPPESISETRDSVFGLYDLVKDVKKPSEREAILGVSVYMVQKRTPEEKKAYADSFSQLIDHAVDRGYSVQFFPMQTTHADVPCIRDIINACQHKDKITLVDWCPETPEHIKMVADCRLFVGHKTHSVIYALAVGTPVIAVAYHRKTQAFMEQFGLQEYCITDAELEGAKLLTLFDHVSACLDQVSEIEIGHACRAGSRVQDDFLAMVNEIRNKLTSGPQR